MNRYIFMVMLISSLTAIVTNANQCLPEAQITNISDIQGAGETSPLVGQEVIIQGRISSNMQKRSKIKGIYVSEHPERTDLKPTTSNAIFIYLPENHPSIPENLKLNEGQSIQIQGRVKEYYGLTELTKVQRVVLCSPDTKPVMTKSLFSLDDKSLESSEGMLINLSQAWVSGNKDLNRYGEIQISMNNPLSTSRRKEIENLVLSMGEKPSKITIFSDSANARIGTKLKPLTGVLHFAYGKYWLIPTKPPLAEKVFRPQIPDNPKNARLSITHLNMKNLFNGNGPDKQFPTSRGAKTLADYRFQLAKIALNFKELNSKIIAVTELENDGYGPQSTIADLVSAINSDGSTSPYKYAAITNESSNQSTDAITQGFLYQPEYITLKDVKFLSLQSSKHPARPALLVSGIINSGQQDFQIAVVHFKSRGRPCPEDNSNTENSERLEGNCSLRREDQMNRLLDQMIATQGIDLIVGDFNAYPNESPLQAARQKGWIRTGELEKLINGNSNNIDFTYVFDNQPVILDHILLHQDDQHLFLKRLDWHINAPESTLIVREEQNNGVMTRFRSSDHDPNLLYLK